MELKQTHWRAFSQCDWTVKSCHRGAASVWSLTSCPVLKPGPMNTDQHAHDPDATMKWKSECQNILNNKIYIIYTLSLKNKNKSWWCKWDTIIRTPNNSQELNAVWGNSTKQMEMNVEEANIHSKENTHLYIHTCVCVCVCVMCVYGCGSVLLCKSTEYCWEQSMMGECPNCEVVLPCRSQISVSVNCLLFSNTHRHTHWLLASCVLPPAARRHCWTIRDLLQGQRRTWVWRPTYTHCLHTNAHHEQLWLAIYGTFPVYYHLGLIFVVWPSFLSEIIIIL